MSVELPFELSVGRGVVIDDLRYVLASIDPDARYNFRRLNSSIIYKVPNATTGFPESPDAAKVLALMAAGKMEIDPPLPADEQAAKRRQNGMDRSDAEVLDPTSLLREAFQERYDANPCNMSDRALTSFYKNCLTCPAFRLLAEATTKAKRKGRKIAAWEPCGKTLRDWINHRGAPGDRQLRDNVSNSGRLTRTKTVRGGKDSLIYWMSQCSANKRDIKANYTSYTHELRLISEGQPTLRRGENGDIVNYPKPTSPHVGKSYATFWRYVMEVRSKPTSKSRHGDQGTAIEYGGGGRLEQATHFGAIGVMDDTPAPILCRLNVQGLVWVGTPTYTEIFDRFTGLIAGWDLSWDSASASTALRTIANASTPKTVPANMVADHPQLAMTMVKFDRIVLDNLSAHHSKHVEDSCREIHTDVDFTGKHKPRDKADIESGLGKFLHLAFKGLPCSVDTIEMRRRDNNDPQPEDMPTLEELRPLIAEAVALKNITTTLGNWNRSPLSSFLSSLDVRKPNIIKDLPRFRRSIGHVEYEIELRASGLRLFEVLTFIQAPRSPSLFEKLRHLERPSRRTKVVSVPVKIKYDADNIIIVNVWDPIDRNYVEFHCAQTEYSEGMSLRIHNMILNDITVDEKAFCSEAKLNEYKADFFQKQTDLTQTSAEAERRRGAVVMASPSFKRFAGEIVEVSDEPDAQSWERAVQGYVDNHLSSETSVDADHPTPRSAATAKSSTADERRDDARQSTGTDRTPARRASPRMSVAQPDGGRDRRGTSPAVNTGRPPRPKSPANRNRSI